MTAALFFPFLLPLLLLLLPLLLSLLLLSLLLKIIISEGKQKNRGFGMPLWLA